LTKEQIEKMVADAEKYKDDDDKHQKRVGAKGKLEQYAYGLRTTIDDPKMKDKVSSTDRETIEKAVKETQSWLESHDSAEAEEYEAKQKELEGQCQPIIMQIYQSAGGAPGGMPGAGGMPDFGGADGGAAPSSGSSAGPKVEEVD
jgi:heat shock protein 1/8